MKAGLLKYSIKIQNPVTVKDSFGANSIKWEDVISTRAMIEYNSGNRQNDNNEIITQYTVTFTIWKHHKVNEYMRILYKEQLYRILYIIRDSYNQSIKIITELINE